MTELYSLRLVKEELVFSAAHFITFNGNICERLHGHNYRVEAWITRPLDENQYVVDFIALRDTLKEIVVALDHHVLLPTTHPLITVETEGSEVIARFEDRRWVFPLQDCLLLPVANTTTELLAKYIGQQLQEEMNRRFSIKLDHLRIGVDENHGQWAYWQSSQ